MPTSSPTASTAVSRSSRLLRLALALDAAVTGLNGAAYVAAASVLDDLLGLPVTLLRGIGVFLLAYGLAVWATGARPTISTRAVLAVIAGNLLWVVGSVTVAAVGLGTPTTLGTVWIVLQAAAVGAFAALQWIGLRT